LEQGFLTGWMKNGILLSALGWKEVFYFLFDRLQTCLMLKMK